MSEILNDKHYSVLVVIVNYQTPELSIQCIESLLPEIEAVEGAHIALVDNGSADTSAQQIADFIAKNELSETISLIKSKKNLGFSGGNNLAVRSIPNSDFVLLLNSDCLITGAFLKHSLEAAGSDRNIGAYSCCVLNEDGSIQNVARKFPSPFRVILKELGLPFKLPSIFGFANTEDPSWDRRTEQRNVEWLGGAFLLIPREVLKKVGLLDERFFFYGEDLEFCFRLKKHGFTCRYDPTASVIHFGGGSSEKTPSESQASSLPTVEKLRLIYKAHFMFQRLCYGRVAEVFLYYFESVILLVRKILASKSKASDKYELTSRKLEAIGSFKS